MNDIRGMDISKHNSPAMRSETKKAACTAAVMFGVLTGMRAKNIKNAGKTKADSCENIKSLMSSSGAIVDTGYNGGDYSVASQYGANSGYSGGNTNSSSNGINFSNGTIPPDQAASVDAQMLSKSGLDKMLYPRAKNINPDTLLKAAENGTLGAMMGGSLGSQGGQFGSALGHSTQAGFDESHLLAAVNPNPGISVASISGGGGGASAGGGKNPFDSMMAGLDAARDPASDAAAQEGGLTSFEGNSDESDIWHSRSNENLFQIISGRIGKSSSKMRLPF